MATPSMKEELLDSEESAETQTGLPSPPSRYLVLSRRTGESEVDGRATQSIMLVRKDDMFRSEGEGGDCVGGAAGGQWIRWMSYCRRFATASYYCLVLVRATCLPSN